MIFERISQQGQKGTLMKKSPFALLKEAIENELFDTALQLQAHTMNNTPINAEFYLGYAEALKFIAQKADYISRYGKPPKF